MVRQRVRRGTVQVSVRVDREVTPDRYQLNTAVLAGYRRQLESLHDQLHVERAIRLESLLALPGVVDEHVDGVRGPRGGLAADGRDAATGARPISTTCGAKKAG